MNCSISWKLRESALFYDIQAGLGTDGEIDRLYFAFVYLRRQSDGQHFKAS